MFKLKYLIKTHREEVLLGFEAVSSDFAPRLGENPVEFSAVVLLIVEGFEFLETAIQLLGQLHLQRGHRGPCAGAARHNTIDIEMDGRQLRKFVKK